MDINRMDEKGENILFSACRIGDIDLVKYIISRNINVKHANTQNETVLSIAIQYYFDDIVKLLIQHDVCDINNKSRYNHHRFKIIFITTLITAIKYNNYHVVKYLLKPKIYIDVLHKSNSKRRINILCMACQYSDVNMVKLLMDHGADVEIYDELDINIPLYYAITHKKNNIVKYLLKCGIKFSTMDMIKLDINQTKGNNIKEIMACQDSCFHEEHILSNMVNCPVDKIEYFINRGVDVNKCLPLMLKAIQNKKYDVVKLLIDNGFDLNINIIYKGSIINLLELACLLKKKNIAKLLIQHGLRIKNVDLNIYSKDIQNTLNLANAVDGKENIDSDYIHIQSPDCDENVADSSCMLM